MSRNYRNTMSSLILKDKKKTIGVVRNPYERAVTEYFYAFNYIGFDKWCLKSLEMVSTTKISYNTLMESRR